MKQLTQLQGIHSNLPLTISTYIVSEHLKGLVNGNETKPV